MVKTIPVPPRRFLSVPLHRQTHCGYFTGLVWGFSMVFCVTQCRPDLQISLQCLGKSHSWFVYKRNTRGVLGILQNQSRRQLLHFSCVFVLYLTVLVKATQAEENPYEPVNKHKAEFKVGESPECLHFQVHSFLRKADNWKIQRNFHPMARIKCSHHFTSERVQFTPEVLQNKEAGRAQQ